MNFTTSFSPIDNDVLEIRKLLFVKYILNAVNDSITYVGETAEFLVLIFFTFNYKNKVSNVCSSYFSLLKIGYLFDLMCFLSFSLKTVFTKDMGYPIIEYVNNIFQWYMFFFLGPWNVALCLNRFTSILFYKKHAKIWSTVNYRIVCLIILFYPFIVDSYSFTNIWCKIDVYANDCSIIMNENFYRVSISNGSFAFVSLCLGVATKFVYHYSIRQHANVSLIQMKVERNLLLQSLFSTFCYGSYATLMATYPYVFSRRNDPNYFIMYVLNLFFVNFSYLLFHYSSFILLFMFS